MSEAPASSKQIVPGDSKAAREIQTILESAAPDLIKKIPRRQREEIARILSLRQTTVTYSHSGPLPSPDDLRKYDNVVDGAADRVIKMAENQQNHRMELEKTAVTEQLAQSARGQHYGLAVAVLMIAASLVMVLAGHDHAGAWLGGTTLVSLTAVFVLGKAMQNSDLAKKREPKG